MIQTAAAPATHQPITRGFLIAHVASSGEINMAVRSENLAHARSHYLELSFVWNGGGEVIAACSNDS